MIKIGVLICGRVRQEIVGKHGEYGGFFERLINNDGFTFVDYFVVDGDFPDSVHACDAYILSGSAHGAYEDHAFIPELEDFIRKAYAQGIAQVGICFGHQIMAQALGGKVVKFDGGWGIGVHAYEMDLGNGPTTINLNAVHQDQVVEKPAEATVIGSSKFCENAAFAYGDKAISFQPHPEFDPDFMKDLITLRRGKSFSEKQSDDAIASLSTDTANSEIAAYIRDFLKKQHI